MKVYIYACEYSYGGLHGNESSCVCDVNSIDEANEIGREMSEEVFYDFMNEEEYLDENGEIDYDLINEELCWEIWKIKDEFINIEDLDEISCNAGRDSFIEDYCEEILN